jgi:hypothetical protein
VYGTLRAISETSYRVTGYDMTHPSDFSGYYRVQLAAPSQGERVSILNVNPAGDHYMPDHCGRLV